MITSIKNYTKTNKQTKKRTDRTLGQVVKAIQKKITQRNIHIHIHKKRKRKNNKIKLLKQKIYIIKNKKI